MRRTYADFLWLQRELEAATRFSLPAPVPTLDEGLDAMAAFLTDLARDDQYQEEPALVAFFFQEEELEAGTRPATFACELGGSEGMDRSELAALPKSHLRAIAAHIHASTRNCVTEFEFADRILARAAGKNEEEEVPVANRDEAGQGFKGLKAVEEDMFDSLASGRAAADSGGRAADDSGAISAAKTAPPPARKAELPADVSTPATPAAAAAPTATVAPVSAEAPAAAAAESADVATAESGPKALRIPVTVAAFLAQLGLAEHTDSFLTGGYDDLRVVAAMKAHEVEALGLTADETDRLLRAGLEWQLRANEAGILDNWARTQFRAGDSGVFEVSGRGIL